MTPRQTTSRGAFITFEGGDGAGKTTQVELVERWLSPREVVRTFEPGGTALGSEIRSLLLHGEELDSRTEALLFAADRAHHVASTVRPALERGAVVLCDRYIDSSVAYQGVGGTLDAEEVRKLSLWATRDLRPHLTVVLDIDPSIGLGRAGAAPDRMERKSIDFHRAVRESYLDQAALDPARYLVLDATNSVEELHATITQRLAPLLGL